MRVLLLFLTLLVLTSWGPALGQPLKVGDLVPEQTLVDAQGQPIQLSQLRERSPSGLVSITFWCSTCLSCRTVEKELADLTLRTQGRAVVIAVSASKGETAAQVQHFLHSHALPLQVYFDPQGKLADLLGVRVTTTTIVLDKENRVRYWGRFSEGEKAVSELLSGQPVTTPRTSQFG